MNHQSKKYLSFCLAFALCALSLSAAEDLNITTETPLQVIKQGTFKTGPDTSYYSIPLNLFESKEALQLTRIDNKGFPQNESSPRQNMYRQAFGGQFAFEISLVSPIEYKVFLYTTNHFNNTSLRQFKNIQGYHYLKLNKLLDYQMEIILEKIDKEEEEEDSEYDEDESIDEESSEEEDEEDQVEPKQNKKIQQTNNHTHYFKPSEEKYTLRIIKLDNPSQKYCPFNCHNHGQCQENGVCSCDNDYSSQYNCLFKLSNLSVNVDDVLSLSSYIDQQEEREEAAMLKNQQQSGQALQKMEENGQSNMLMTPGQDTMNISQMKQSENNQTLSEEWLYATLDIKNVEEIKNQIHYRQQFNDVPSEILISFSYKKYHHVDASIAILDPHNYFKVLETEEEMGEIEYLSTFAVMSVDYYKFLIDSTSSGQLIVFAYNRHLRDLQIQVQIIYDDFKLFYESLQLLVVVLSTILLFVFMAITCRKNGPFKREEDGLPLTQLNQQNLNSILRPAPPRLTKAEIQNIMKTQLKCYQYHISSQTNIENGSHTECFICLSTYEESDELSKTQCGHVFHKICLDAWLQKNLVCPIDRSDILANNQKKN